MTIKELITAAGMTQTSFAKRFGIPLRTVQGWCNNTATPAPYIVTMAAEILGITTK